MCFGEILNSHNVKILKNRQISRCGSSNYPEIFSSTAKFG
jgi:hypothetical protein